MWQLYAMHFARSKVSQLFCCFSNAGSPVEHHQFFHRCCIVASTVIKLISAFLSCYCFFRLANFSSEFPDHRAGSAVRQYNEEIIQFPPISSRLQPSQIGIFSCCYFIWFGIGEHDVGEFWVAMKASDTAATITKVKINLISGFPLLSSPCVLQFHSFAARATRFLCWLECVFPN